MTDERIVGTPHGEARIVAYRARRPVATLALGHGAGGGIDSGDLAALAARLPKQDINVFLIEQPWRRAGKKLAPAPKVLDEAWIAIIGQLRVRTPLVIGGRSAGARVACRTASSLGASGVLALAFPLHAPGKPEKSRVAELQGAGLPTLVVQGERDTFGTPEEFPPLTEMAVVPDADHAFKVPKKAVLTQEESYELLVEAVLEWVVREVSG
ncbi:putative alpha/beta-hydrolase family hydrolase [Kribbella sandramycini]|uniref:Putative alpha/beta-hydrolase family hydrolase n=1 Tax=Kribbella sandramycini TaxID=60450 RepID=A0A841SP89_9ACTN|nr:putative alpha/beta-hydrolase family hydrolase [Kribbella sandramycini]